MFDIAVFGAGRIGRIHARNVVAHPALRLKYLVDPAPDAAGLAGQTGAALVDTNRVLGDPGIAGVIIASPTHLHLDQCLQAVAAGKAVFCEKPIDLDLQRARAAHARLTAPNVRLLLVVPMASSCIFALANRMAPLLKRISASFALVFGR